MVEKTNSQSDKELEEYRKQAMDLWFKDGSCTGGKNEMGPEQMQDSQNEDDEFHRIENEQKLKSKN